MKKQITAAFICLALTASGCSQQPDKAKKEDQASAAKQENPVQKPAETKEVSWEGKWIFLSNDNLGNLDIQKTGEKEITYTLSGSKYNSYNGSSYGNVLEGKGTIEGDKITFTNDLVEGCGGVMEKKDNVITVKASDEMCHTPAVYLDGEFIKADTITPPKKLSFENGEFKLFGITLGNGPVAPKKHLGNPEYEGPDEDGFYSWMVHQYPKQNLTIAYTNNDEVQTISTSASLDELEALSGEFDRDHYTDEEGSHYLYNPDNKQLLIYNEKAEEPIHFFATYADENFYASLENGWIKKK